MGVGDALERIEPELLLDSMRNTDDPSTATFNVQTAVMAKPGTTISGDDIAALIEESRETGVPIAKLVDRLDNVQTMVQILPGDGIPEAAPRAGGRGSKRNKPIVK